MPKRRIRGITRKYKWTFSLLVSIGFFALYVIFYKTLEESGSGGPQTDETRFSTAFNVTEVRLFPIRIPPFSTHNVPDYTVPREGPGENGMGVTLTGEEEQRAKLEMKHWFMNTIASDKISLDRSVPDQRSEECKSITYGALPKTSVIIIFTDEYWSVLLRTVHSVINRTPVDLLEEIVLVDDFSQREDLHEKLEHHLRRFGNKVRLIRSHNRLGLIRAKMVGAQFSKGEVLVFLDSHCETSEGWLEPLLHRIGEEKSAVVCPVIDMISDKDIAYLGGAAGGIGTFWWSLHYKMDSMPEREIKRRKNPQIDYIRTPTMAGGLFAANREFFFHVGSYDSGMDIWGGENLEISFRVWMCGGSVEIIPCSHIGHIYRNGHPYNMTGTGGNKDVHGTNSKRLAEVWMDDYKRLFYVHRMGLKDTDVGDLSERKALRNRLKCHTFKWYLENIVPEKFIPDENVKAYGLVENRGEKDLCLDTLQRLENKGEVLLGVYSCQRQGSSSQTFSLSMDNRLRRETTCVDVYKGSTNDARLKAVLKECELTEATFEFTNDGNLKHLDSKLCLDAQGLKAGDDVHFTSCSNSDTQKWKFLQIENS